MVNKSNLPLALLLALVFVAGILLGFIGGVQMAKEGFEDIVEIAVDCDSQINDVIDMVMESCEEELEKVKGEKGSTEWDGKEWHE